MIKPTTHIMIDIETLGLRPGAVVWQIGALHFIPELYPNKEMFKNEWSWTIDLASAMEHGVIEAGALEMWLKIGFSFHEKRVGMELALCELSAWILEIQRSHPGTQLSVWAKGPSFDLVQLEYQYHTRNLACPWSFRDHRDVRTIIDLADVDASDHIFGTKHYALDDCKSQALAVGDAYGRLFRRGTPIIREVPLPPILQPDGKWKHVASDPPDYFCQGWDWT